MVGGRENVTTTAQSPYDKEKWETAKQLFKLLAPQVISGMTGAPTAATAKATKEKAKSTREAASKSKVAPGSPAMYSSPYKGGNDMMSYALQLYGIQNPQMPGSSATTVKPGGVDYANTIADLYKVYQAYGNNSKSSGSSDGGIIMNDTGLRYG